ncbi:MAG: cytochrome c [Epsilonproteobacteria bacterium]|nr:cytochrome c [Campylobacterota bacterium]
MKNIIKTTTLALVALLSMNTTVFADEVKQVDIANGAQVWADTCMRCHNVRPPSDLTVRAWSFSMNHMRVRAGLTGQETRDILAFIRASKTEEDRK